jgi:uncharacterized protein
MTTLDAETWALARTTVHAAQRGNLHCSVASLNPDGTPHVTPIGSIMLSSTPGTGFYFDVLNARLARNVGNDPNVTILAVDSRRSLWLRALIAGRFSQTPGVQLKGTVSPRRAATPAEIDRFHRQVRPLLRTRGGRTLWANADYVRDLTITAVTPIRLGAMTKTAAS